MNTWCITVTGAVTMSNLITLASPVSEICLATDRQTSRHILLVLVFVSLFKVLMTLRTKSGIGYMYMGRGRGAHTIIKYLQEKNIRRYF